MSAPGTRASSWLDHTCCGQVRKMAGQSRSEERETVRLGYAPLRPDGSALARLRAHALTLPAAPIGDLNAVADGAAPALVVHEAAPFLVTGIAAGTFKWTACSIRERSLECL